jgi:hypothetical protein
MDAAVWKIWKPALQQTRVCRVRGALCRQLLGPQGIDSLSLCHVCELATPEEYNTMSTINAERTMEQLMCCCRRTAPAA